MSTSIDEEIQRGADGWYCKGVAGNNHHELRPVALLPPGPALLCCAVFMPILHYLQNKEWVRIWGINLGLFT